MKYNQPHAGASWGTQAKDWERGIDYDRLFKARLKRAPDAVSFAGLGAVLCFHFAIFRYVTGTHIGEWARDKFMRYALFPVDGDRNGVVTGNGVVVRLTSGGRRSF